MTKYIFYGAGKYAQEHFEDFRKKYEPLCFCDRSAGNVDGGGQMIVEIKNLNIIIDVKNVKKEENERLSCFVKSYSEGGKF